MSARLHRSDILSQRSVPWRHQGFLCVALATLVGTVVPGLGQSLPDTTPAGTALLLIHARLVDPHARSIEEASLLLAGGKVVARGGYEGASLVSASAGAQTIDLKGAYVLPGLVDLRVHAGAQRSPGHVDEIGPEGTSRLLTSAGVTSYLDVHLGAESLAWKDRQSATASKSARVSMGSPLLTTTGGRGVDYPSSFAVTTKAEVDGLLNDFAPYQGERKSAAFTVVFDSRPPYRRLSREILAHLMSDMRQRGLPIVVEVGNWMDVEEALAEGARWLCHLPEGEMPQRVRDLVRALRPRWIPTVAVGIDFADLLQDEVLRADPLLRRVAPIELIEDYPSVRIPQTRYAELRERRSDLYRTLSELNQLGARLLAGSDAGAVGSFFGWSLHRELHHWSEAGIQPWEILAAATVEPAQFLGQRYGFAVGSAADLVVLRSNPVEDLATMQQPVAVIAQGRWVDVEAIAANVLRQITVHEPENPVPFGGRLGLFFAVVLGFAVLLSVRAAIRREVRKGDEA
jgi:imidazolonepropionase-like amidohydrolase